MCCDNKAALKALQGAACACLEQLEVRRLMSSSYYQPKAPPPKYQPKEPECTAQTYDTDRNRCYETLKICGTERCDTVTIWDDAKCDTLTVWIDKDGDKCIDECEVKEYKDVQKIEVDLKGGDDKLKYVLVSDLCRDKRNIKIDLGCGDDCFEIESGCLPQKRGDTRLEVASSTTEGEHGSADITDCSELCLDVKGNDGNDRLNFNFAKTSIKDSKVTINADAGKGNDCVEYSLPALGEVEQMPPTLVSANGTDGPGLPGLEAIGNSSVKATFNLGSGCNTMKLQTRTFIADSKVETCIIGGCDSDKVYDEQAFALLGCTTYSVKTDLGGGNDSYCQTLNANNYIDCKASACFEVKGGDGCDELKTRIDKGEREEENPQLTSEEELFSGIQGSLAIVFDGGCGNDKVSIDLSCVALSVGEKGKLKLHGIGGDGNDCVEVVARVDECSKGCYDIQVLGGKGDDKVALGFQDDSCGREEPNTLAVAEFRFGNYTPKQPAPKSRHGLVLDGGSGCDQWDTEGNKGEEVCPRNVERLCEGLLPPFCDRLIEL